MILFNLVESTESEPILREAFSDWASAGGIFSAMGSLNGLKLPWADDFVDNAILDIEYFGNKAGARYCSPLVKYYLVDGKITSTGKETIAKVIATKYRSNWQRLWDANELTYNPIANYRVETTREFDRSEEKNSIDALTQTHTGTDTLQHGLVNMTTNKGDETLTHGLRTQVDEDSTDTMQHGLVDSTTKNETDSAMTYRYGFDSTTDDVIPSDRTDTTINFTEQSTKSGSDVDTLDKSTVTENSGNDVKTFDTTETSTNSGSDVTTKNLTDASNDTFHHGITGDENEHIVKEGTIGTHTYQSLISQERELWIWNYFETVFKDVTKELALVIMDPCRV